MGKLIRWLALLIVGGGFLGLLAATGAYFYLAPQLPSIESLRDVHLQVPLRVYTRDGLLIANFGEKRRVPVELEEVPETMIRAVLASEDERFFEHPGVDWQGLTRAVLYLVKERKKGPGGSTITMQVARNFFLGREKTYLRKANEILLALKIERELSKEEILELYLNKIFLGQRAYGVGAAASVYYGKTLKELSLPQIAMIAGLPKAPSRFNPIANPERALERRNYVLQQMHELGFLDGALYRSALNAPITAELHELPIEVDAPYVAEMTRAEMEARFGEEATTAGYKAYASIDSRLQEAANAALRIALLDYDRRHGYRGAEFQLDLSAPDFDADAVLGDIPEIGGMLPALVTVVEEQEVSVYTREHGPLTLPFGALAWARPYINENRLGNAPERPGDVVAPGDVIRVMPTEAGWTMTQIPDVEGALVSLDPMDGAIAALAGGFDFRRSKFNRVIQARRQPGSSFKPFIYSAALDSGFTPASIILDAPIVFDDPGLEAAWRPENYSGKFFGETRLREALTKSRNLVSIRLLRAMGVEKAIEYLGRFGFERGRLPENLSLALGTATLTPLEMVNAFAVLANGGYRVEPYFIDRVVDANGRVAYEADPLRVCRECDREFPELQQIDRGEADALNGSPLETSAREEPRAERTRALGEGPHGASLLPFRIAPRVISARNAWLMHSMLRDVIRHGTGRKALKLGRDDLAGKTGTTNDLYDAWFSGFNPTLVATAWVGFDQLRPLGRRETGAGAALPMWMAFMEEALKGVESTVLEQPEGLVTVRIDPQTGQRASAAHPEAIFETFQAELVPKQVVEAGAVLPTNTDAAPVQASGEVTEQLF